MIVKNYDDISTGFIYTHLSLWYHNFPLIYPSSRKLECFKLMGDNNDIRNYTITEFDIEEIEGLRKNDDPLCLYHPPIWIHGTASYDARNKIKHIVGYFDKKTGDFSCDFTSLSQPLSRFDFYILLRLTGMCQAIMKLEAAKRKYKDNNSLMFPIRESKELLTLTFKSSRHLIKSMKYRSDDLRTYNRIKNSIIKLNHAIWISNVDPIVKDGNKIVWGDCGVKTFINPIANAYIDDKGFNIVLGFDWFLSNLQNHYVPIKVEQFKDKNVKEVMTNINMFANAWLGEKAHLKGTTRRSSIKRNLQGFCDLMGLNTKRKNARSLVAEINKILSADKFFMTNRYLFVRLDETNKENIVFYIKID